MFVVGLLVLDWGGGGGESFFGEALDPGFEGLAVGGVFSCECDACDVCVGDCFGCVGVWCEDSDVAGLGVVGGFAVEDVAGDFGGGGFW